MDKMDGIGQEWTAEWTMDNGQEWTRTAGDIFCACPSRPFCP